ALASGVSQEKADQIYTFERKFTEAIAGARDAAEAKVRTRAVLEAADPKPSHNEEEAALQAAGLDWYRFFLTYDPVPALRKVRVPVLALNGSLDLQVPASQNLPPIRAALANNRDATVMEMAGLNHLFQHARTGAPKEYGAIEETLAPELLQTL